MCGMKKRYQASVGKHWVKKFGSVDLGAQGPQTGACFSANNLGYKKERNGCNCGLVLTKNTNV